MFEHLELKKEENPSTPTHELTAYHPLTKEPVLEIHAGWKRSEKRLMWHPHMLETHPQLKDSYKHHPRRFNVKKFTTEGGKDAIKYAATRIYKDAAMDGFDDPVPKTVVERDPEDPSTHKKVVWHDPETNEPIVHHEPGGRWGETKFTVSSEFMQKHGISKDLLKGLHNLEPMDVAHRLSQEKNKVFHAVGSHSFDKVRTRVFKVQTSPEEASAAHERHVRSTYGDRANFNLVRHSPTAFSAEYSMSHSPDSDTQYHKGHVSSVVMGDHLHSHEHEPKSKSYETKTNLDRLE